MKKLGLILSFFLIWNSAFSSSISSPGESKSESKISRRDIPNFDGRVPALVTTSEALLWVPRVVFFPAYLVSEYVYRQPLRWLGRTVEQNNIPFLVADLFKFGEDNRFAIYPSLLVDFGFRPSMGFRFRWKDFLQANNRLNVRAATGGTDYGIVQISDEWHMDSSTALHITAEIGRRPDYIFHAMGPMSSKDDRYRYTLIKKQLGVGITTKSLFADELTFETSLRSHTFSNSNCCGDPGIGAGIQNGLFTSPSKFQEGYSVASQSLTANWGNRVSRPSSRLGGIVDTFASHSFVFSGAGWFEYGGALTGFVDVTGRSRLFSVKAEAELTEPYGGNAVPFDELASIGGDRLQGFLSRRFIGESAFALTLEYKWPVLSVVDSAIHFAVGNVFGPQLRGLQWGWLRKSVGLSFEGTGGKTSPFGILVALGSQPFDLGGAFDELRISLKIGGGI